MISEYPMRPGAWALELDPQTPVGILDQLDQRGTLSVCPGRLEYGATDSTVLAAARYSGLLHRRAGTLIEGTHVSGWLGDADGKGLVVKDGTGSSGATKPFSGASGWVTWLTASTYMTAGTTTTDTNNRTLTIQYMTYRQALDLVCDAYGYEWRFNPDASLDAGSTDDLYGSTPTALFVADSAGREVDHETVRTLDVAVEVDTEDWTSEVMVLDTSSTYTTVGGNFTATYNYLGNIGKVTRFIDASATVATSAASAFGTTQLGRFDDHRRRMTVVADEYDVTGRIEAGARAWIYDPVEGLVDTANEVAYHGQTIHPIEVRVVGVQWPVLEGMGVYFRRADAAGTIVDLTDWVVFEDGAPTTLEVGAASRRLTNQGVVL